MDNRIKMVRDALKLSQREFGEKLGASRDVISNLEHGRVQPKGLFLHHMCQIYAINEHWLETGEGEMFAGNSLQIAKLDEAVRLFKSLRPEFQDYALEQLRKLAELQQKQ